MAANTANTILIVTFVVGYTVSWTVYVHFPAFAMDFCMDNNYASLTSLILKRCPDGVY